MMLLIDNDDEVNGAMPTRGGDQETMASTRLRLDDDVFVRCRHAAVDRLTFVML